MQTLNELITTLKQKPEHETLFASSQSINFTRLAQSVLQISQDLRHLQSQRVALCAEASIDFICHLLACWQANLLPLIVSPWQAKQIDWLQGYGVSALYSQGNWQLLQAALNPDSSTQFAPDMQNPHAAALVLFTSGSSGQAKGVVLSHQNILSNIEAVILSMQDTEACKTAVSLPLYHSFALITQVLLSLIRGGELHLLSPDWLAGQKIAYLQQNQINSWAGVPTQFRILLDSTQNLPYLQKITVAGAALDQDLANLILTACPQSELWVGYGLTEAGPRVSTLSHQDPHFRAGSVGKALPGCQLQVQDEILWVQSPSVMLGYLDQPEETDKVLQNDWLKTGDQASLIDDYLYICGRSDDIFQVAGEKIAPLEIENCLQACKGVQQVAIYPQADLLLGNTIIALIEGEVNLAQLKRHVRQHLTAEKRPQNWYAVTSLPLTPNGKLRRKELPQWPRQPLN